MILKLYFKYFLYWLLFFQIARIIFILVNLGSAVDTEATDLLSTMWYGLPLDLSTAGYLMILPILGGIVSSIIRLDFTMPLRVYSMIILIILALIVGTDAHLYGYWGFRFDATPLLYLETPDIIVKSLSFKDFAIPLLISTMLPSGAETRVQE